MGKGDWRRPSQVSREEEAKRWEEAFGTGPKLNIMTPEELAELEETLNHPYADLSIPDDDIRK